MARVASLQAAETLGQLQRYPEALTAAEKVLELEPRNATAHLMRGELTGSPELRRHEYELAAAIRPGDAGTQTALADLYRRQRPG